LSFAHDGCDSFRNAFTSQYRILLYGDSNTAGFVEHGTRFVPYGDSLQIQLADLGINCKISRCGLCGYTAKEMADKMGSRLLARKHGCGEDGKGLMTYLRKDSGYDLVVIMAGTNDLLVGSAPQVALQSIIRLHAACHAEGIRTVAIAPSFAMNQAARHQLASGLLKYANANSDVIGFADIEALLPRTSRNAYWDNDLVHMTALGSAVFGERLADELRSNLEDLEMDMENCRSEELEAISVRAFRSMATKESQQNKMIQSMQYHPTLFTCRSQIQIHRSPFSLGPRVC